MPLGPKKMKATWFWEKHPIITIVIVLLVLGGVFLFGDAVDVLD